MNEYRLSENLEPVSDSHLIAQVAIEKISYMRDFAKSSTVATIVAPLLCIPLYESADFPLRFHVWLALMAVAVCIRIFLIQSIRLDSPTRTNFLKLNWAVAVVTFVWGIGWLMLVTNMELVNYLLYQIISLTVLFVGMVGYCVNWKTFYSFALPLKIPELLFIAIHLEFSIWPIAIGSMVTFYLALRMGFLFSKSWEKSISLRYKNEQLFEQLTFEKDASVAANVAKSEFIATASHDLRQPMQAINIFIELVNFKNLADREKSIFQKMHSSITVLNKMFNTLLDISKLDSNLNPSHSDFELASVVHDIGLTFNPLAIEKGLTLDFHYENYLVRGDMNLTEQILRNLLANAIQYTDTGGVVVNFKREFDQLSISVQDTGCGIPEQDLPYIYKEFFRSQNSRSQHDGLGLGLSIVSRIVQKIGGTLSVSTETKIGSIFTVNTQFTILGIQSQGSRTSRSIERPDAAQRADNASIKHLGILENDKSLMYAYMSYFTSIGYEVHSIPHTEIEFKNALIHTPKLDFILSDYRLGDHDGIYFIETLREEFNEIIPACIVTADTTPQHLNLFKELQIEVLYKPIDVHSISEFIASRVR
jgi:signal transduction histidine kinase/CheY-like chemotaxis protein